MSEKVCSKCNTLKSLSEFYSQKKYSKKRGDYTYYHPECKECAKRRSSIWISENREKHLESKRRYNHKEKPTQDKREFAKRQRESGYFKKWQQENKDKVKMYNSRRQHKNHDITDEEWERCKEYFNYRCAYCSISDSEAKSMYGNYLHKEHVDHEGADDLSNCVPACKLCNGQKHIFELNEWYNHENPRYSDERLVKINKWINGDYKNSFLDK